MAKFRNALFVRGPSVHPKVVRKKIKLVLQRSLSLSLSTRKGWRLIVRRCFVLFFRWPRNIRFFLISFVEKNSSSVRCVLIKNTGVSFRSWKYFFASHCLLTAHGSVTEKGGEGGSPDGEIKLSNDAKWKLMRAPGPPLYLVHVPALCFLELARSFARGAACIRVPRVR